jgi:hypothetical protein
MPLGGVSMVWFKQPLLMVPTMNKEKHTASSVQGSKCKVKAFELGSTSTLLHHDNATSSKPKRKESPDKDMMALGF